MYSIDRYYVGVVRPSKSISNMPFGDATRKRAEIDEIIENGGIPLDLTNDIPGYDSALTVFIKTGHDDLDNVDVFMCLHDMGTYYCRESEVLNPCDNMIPLEDIMPRLSSFIYPAISVQEARIMFDSIFKNPRKSKIMKEEYYSGLFFEGELHLCTSVLEDGEFKRINIPQQYLLDHSPSQLVAEYSRGKEVPEVDYEIGKDRMFRRYDTILYYLYGNKYYSLFDHQTYPSIERDPVYGGDPLPVGPKDSYCANIKPLETGKKDKISLDQAVKKHKQYIKKNY